jgi:Ca2+-binding RTX toxin-like protein
LVSASGGKVYHDDIERASLTGGAGKNHLNASLFSGDVTLNGGGDNDLIRGGSGNDVLYGGTGNDRIYGGPGDDNINGQDGNDQLWGEAGEDTMRGGNNNDWLWGGDDNDWINGEAGDDILQGGTGDDTMFGGDNNDRLFGDAGNDILNGGTGVDLYDLQGTNNAEDLQLTRVNATSASFRRKPRGLVSVLELDTITMDAMDEFLISALSGDDLIAIDLTFSQLGSIDGGDGTDSCTAPAAWTKVSC